MIREWKGLLEYNNTGTQKFDFLFKKDLNLTLTCAEITLSSANISLKVSPDDAIFHSISLMLFG